MLALVGTARDRRAGSSPPAAGACRRAPPGARSGRCRRRPRCRRSRPRAPPSDTPSQRAHAAGVDDRQVVDLEHRRAGPRAPASPRASSTRRPTISSASSAGEVVARVERRDHLAAAHDRDAVGHGHDLAQLVGDQDDGLALRLSARSRPKSASASAGVSTAGRLVEDQDLGAAQERLHDLDPLLQPDRELADDGVGIDDEPVVAGKPRHLGPRRARRRREQRAALGAEHDVLDHGQRLDQHEMLVDHADAGPDRVGRRADPLRLCRRCGSRRNRLRRSRTGSTSSVDLPAPFSPTMPWIVPRATARLTSRLAWTAPKRLSMWRSSIAGTRRLPTCGRAAIRRMPPGEGSSRNPHPDASRRMRDDGSSPGTSRPPCSRAPGSCRP